MYTVTIWVWSQIHHSPQPTPESLTRDKSIVMLSRAKFAMSPVGIRVGFPPTPDEEPGAKGKNAALGVRKLQDGQPAVGAVFEDPPHLSRGI